MANRSCSVASQILIIKAARCGMVASLLLVAEAFTTSFKTSAEGKNVFMIPLDKQHVPVLSNGRQVAVKTAYYGEIFVGAPRPQKFTVVFDTGSGHVLLPSIQCTAAPCKLHQRYDPAASKTSIPINHDGEETPALDLSERDKVSIGYGTGEIQGDFVRETVCVGMSAETSEAPNCARLRMVTAVEMTDEPFSSFKFDGVLGLGLTPLAVDPEFHFFEQLAKGMQVAPIFSVFLSKSDDVQSEITFGGHDQKRMVGGPEGIKFLPVEKPQNGHWSVKIQGVRVGNTPLPLCDNGSCTAIVDTGTSLLGIPSNSMSDFFYMTVRKLSDHVASSVDADVRTQVPESEWPDCRHVPGPPIIFDMGDFEIVLQAEDYTRPAPMDVKNLDNDSSNVTHTVCKASLMPVNMGFLGERVFIFGEPVLQKYYTSFDFGGQRVGFATALHPSPEEQPKNETTTEQVLNEGFIEV